MLLCATVILKEIETAVAAAAIGFKWFADGRSAANRMQID
jgi:hypothetical protein